MARKKIDPDERDRAIALRIRDAEGAVATLVFRLEGLTRNALAQDAPGHAGLYDQIALLLAQARVQIAAAAELMETGDPDAFAPDDA